MEYEKEDQSIEDTQAVQPVKKNYTLPASILVSSVILAGAWVYTAGLKTTNVAETKKSPSIAAHEAPAAQTAEIPATWGDLGAKMAAAGVYDKNQLLELYSQQGGLSAESQKLVDGRTDGTLKVNEKNAGLLLNLLWALGLSNKNKILENGPMADPRYGGAGRFSSTGGWTIAKGDPMSHYSMHRFITLAASEQALVETVAKNIYRPCCGNSVYFPDCNHGMAMLGLLELMASQGATEAQIYRAALVMNSYWFPDQYATIARYLESKGISPQSADPKEILGAAYSSAQGFTRIQSLAPAEQPTQPQGGCAVDSGQAVQPQQQQNSCGV